MPDFGDVTGGSSSAPEAPSTIGVNASLPGRVRRNLERMLRAGATASDVRDYMHTEGFENKSDNPPMPSPAPVAKTGATQASQIVSQEPTQEERRKANGDAWAGFGANALQSLTLGGADNVLDLVGIVAGPDMADSYRRRIEEYELTNPKSAMAAKAFGAAPLAFIPGGGLGIQMAQGAALGGAAGALSADDKVGTPGNRTVGGAAGAVLGGLLPPALRGAGAILGPLARGTAKLFGFGNTAIQSDMVIARDILRGGGFDKAITAAKRAEAEGVPHTFAEVGGESARELVEHVMHSPGEGAQIAKGFIGDRQTEQPVRLLERLSESLGTKAADAYKLGQQIILTRLAKSKPFYDKAFEEAPMPATHALERLMKKSPAIEKAWEVGRQIAAQDPQNKIKIPPLFKEIVNPKTGRVTRQFTEQIPIKGVDYMKLGLDKLLNEKANGVYAIDRKIVPGLRELKNEILKRADKWSPNYAKARLEGVEGYEAQAALEAGMEALKRNTPPSRIAEEMQRFSTPGEQELYRVGVLQHAFDEMAKGGTISGDHARNLIQGKGSLRRKQLEAVFSGMPGGDKAFQNLMDGIETLELPMSQTANRVGNSRTFGRMMKGLDIDGGIDLVKQVVNRTSLRGMMAGAASNKVAGAGNAWQESVRDQIARKATLTGPELTNYLMYLRDVAERQVKPLDMMRQAVEKEGAVRGGAGLGKILQQSGGSSVFSE